MAQVAAKIGNIAENVVRACGAILESVAKGAELVVFPELFLCGYDLTRIAADRDVVLDVDQDGFAADDRLSPVHRVIGQTGAYALVGAAIREPAGVLRNSLLLFAPGAKARAVYHKQYLWQDSERAVFAPGDRNSIIDIGGTAVGLSICHDGSFPEHARVAALSGAHIYLASSSYTAGYEYCGNIYLAARALENTIYSVFLNYPKTGPSFPETAMPTCGASTVYGPNGAVLAAASEGEQLLFVQPRADLLRSVRADVWNLSETHYEPILADEPVVTRLPRQGGRNTDLVVSSGSSP